MILIVLSMQRFIVSIVNTVGATLPAKSALGRLTWLCQKVLHQALQGIVSRLTAVTNMALFSKLSEGIF